MTKTDLTIKIMLKLKGTQMNKETLLKSFLMDELGRSRATAYRVVAELLEPTKHRPAVLIELNGVIMLNTMF